MYVFTNKMKCRQGRPLADVTDAVALGPAPLGSRTFGAPRHGV